MRRRRPLALMLAGLLLGLALPGLAPAQTGAADAGADWQEGAVPPPPAYSVDQLIDVDARRGAALKIGVDPRSIQLDLRTGVVRYVVVARGPGATNAMYEGIRCKTGEYRVYARQSQNAPWSANRDDRWHAMRGQTHYPHPYRLARDGMCLGTAVNPEVADIVRALRSPQGTLYAD